MKTNTFILYPLLFIGIVSFGQDLSTLSFSSENFNPSHYQKEINFQKLDYRDSDSEKPPRDVPWFIDRFSVSGGFYEALNHTIVEVSSPDGTKGTSINLENDLGYDKFSPSFFGDFKWHLNARSHISLSYYNLRRNAEKVIDREIVFDDKIYEINTHIESTFKTPIYRLAYGYSLISKPKYEVGLSAGLHVIGYNITLGIQGANVNATKKDNYSLTAPLPNFGIYGGWAISDRFAVTGEFDYLAATIDKYKGELLANNFMVVFKAFPQLNLSAGFSSVTVHFDYDGVLRDAHLSWGNRGGLFKVTYTFGKKDWL